MDIDDVTLMMRVRGGDRRAFDLLVQRHSQRAVNMLFRMVGNRDDAEELAQEAFLRAYRARTAIGACHPFSLSHFPPCHTLSTRRGIARPLLCDRPLSISRLTRDARATIISPIEVTRSPFMPAVEGVRQSRALVAAYVETDRVG